MKQEIVIGNVVDDGAGDYLRKGGQKTNSNFTELYTQLGDGEVPHAAGAWKTSAATTLNPQFGQSWTLNTSSNVITVNLPKGGVGDYNKVIRLRDVWGKWSTNNVKIIPATGDTIKGSPTPRELYKDYMDVELVYCSLGRWEYVENKQVDKITTSDLSTVASKAFIATQGQTDFINVFGVNMYNIRNVEVYYRGNLLYYGESFDATNSDYGSPTATAGQMVALDGMSIRLRNPCNAGDTVQIVTYMDGIASFRSTYEAHTMRVYNTGETEQTSIAGEIWVGDLATKKQFTNAEFGISNRILVNPNSFECFLNGRLLTKGGDADLPSFSCEGADGYSEDDCVANSGSWVASGMDYSLIMVDSIVTGIKFNEALESRDIVSIRWYNNDIGTTMEWEGVGGIKEHTDKVYLNNEGDVTLVNKVEYTDYNNPSQKTMRAVAQEPASRILDVQAMFDIFHPIGTIYENAHNPANPSDYMGFGVWTRYAEGMFLAGWSTDATDSEFGLNNNDLDGSGQPTHTAGGSGGERGVEIKPINTPQLVSTDKVLVKDDNGAIIVGGCQLDPDATGPGYTKYREDTLKVNQGNTTPDKLNIVPPYTTVHRWIRVG